MNARRLALAALAAGATLALDACLPSRDNPNDPQVHPSPSLVVRVDGAEGTIGGRGRRWVFDGSGSSSPKGTVTSWSWSIADHAAAKAEDPTINWLPVGSAATIASASGEAGATFSQALRDALFAISDFGADGLQSTSRFVKLDVRDSNGRAATATTLLIVENHAPQLSLGPDLRVSPGGKWWELTPGSDILTAPPFQETLTLRIQDPDGDEDAIATPTSPARWHVSGTLALTYDLDRDGLVDDAFFSDPSHRSLTVAAPIAPARDSFEVEVSDVGALGAGAPADGDATVRLDVLTNAWLYDAPLNRFTRLDTTRWVDSQLVGSTLPIASDSRHALLLEQQGSQLNLRVVDQALTDVQRLNAAPIGFAGVSATADGVGGWWIGEGPDGTTFQSSLRHYKVSGATLVNDVTVKSVEGAATSDIGTAGVPPIASAQDGSGAVWVLGQTDGAGAARLYRVTLAGAATVKIDAAPSSATQLMSDGAGGAWIGGENGATQLAAVRRVDATGATVLDLDLPAGVFPSERVYSFGFDPTRQVLWATKGNGNSYELVRVDASNPGAIPPPIHQNLSFKSYFAPIYPDIADGTILMNASGNLPVVVRIGVAADGASFEELDSIDAGGITVDSMVPMLGGSLLAQVSDFGSNPRLVWFEASANSPETDVPITFGASEAGAVQFSVDPATGFLWIPRPAYGTVEVHAGDGTLVRSIAAASPGRPDATLTVDPETRTAYVGWSAVATTAGAIDAIAMDATNGAVTTLPLNSIGEVGDLEMAPGRSLCIAASATGSYDQRLFSWSGQTATQAFDTGFVSAAGSVHLTADDADGSCWFFGRFFTSVFRQDVQGATTTFTNPVNPVTTISIAPNAGAAAAWWTGKLWVPDANADNVHPATDTTGWLLSFGPGTTGVAPANPKPVVTYSGKGSVDFLSSPTSMFADPFYRHVWVAFGDPIYTGSGVVLRLDQHNVEVDRATGFLSPHLHSLH